MNYLLRLLHRPWRFSGTDGLKIRRQFTRHIIWEFNSQLQPSIVDASFYREIIHSTIDKLADVLFNAVTDEEQDRVITRL